MNNSYPIHPVIAQGWSQNECNRRNWPRYLARLEAQKIDPCMEPYRCLPSPQPDTARGRYGFIDGYETCSIRSYRYRAGGCTKVVLQTTVTSPTSGPTVCTEEFIECPGALNTLVRF